jgi:hypothetical protein
MSEKRGEDQKPSAKKVYGRPELQRLGSLRDMTMGQSFGAPDGMPHMGTGRGGEF